MKILQKLLHHSLINALVKMCAKSQSNRLAESRDILDTVSEKIVSKKTSSKFP